MNNSFIILNKFLFIMNNYSKSGLIPLDLEVEVPVV